MKSTVHTQRAADPQSGAVMEVKEALQRLGDDRDLLRDIMQVYLEDAPSLLDRVHVAANEGDGSALQRAAHSLKGLGATLSAYELVGAASRLEHLGAARTLGESAVLVEAVESRVAELTQAIEQFLRRK